MTMFHAVHLRKPDLRAIEVEFVDFFYISSLSFISYRELE